ncbi:MAG: rod shape-determining protein RodA [Candidatus Marinimicrobia bacterium]|nr:rod shape-determining protein RodA [Candidatus Neomarinimicrobiota bacterium]
MLLNIWQKIKNSPTIILIPVFILLLLGLLSLLSIATLQNQAPPNAFSKQLFFLIPSFIMLFVMSVLSKRLIHKYIYVFYVLVVFAVLLPFLGDKVSGTYRWINFGLPFDIQPSEIAKWIIVLVLARYLSDHNLQMTHFSSNLFPLLIALIPTIIVLKQPDLGTAFVMMSSVLPMLYWIGARPFHLFMIVAPLLSILLAFNVSVFYFWAFFLAIIIYLSKPKLIYGLGVYFGNIFLGLIFPLVWNSLRPYQQNRVLTYINPEIDPLGAGYHIIQSKTALGSGGLFGKGWGQGTQTHLKFLPVQESDFIVSAIGEELGFIFLLLMILLFFFFIYKILRLAINASDRFSGLILIGLASIFMAHIFINSAMASGLMPVKGLPLPFISYGGSFLVSSFMMVGMILNFGRDDGD